MVEACLGRPGARRGSRAWWLVGLLFLPAACASEVGDEGRAPEPLSACEGPTIVSWYGETLRPGRLGHPQTAFNVLGNVSSPQGVASLSYSLDGGPFAPLPVGPGPARLHGSGDFNVVLELAQLAEGPNVLELRAEDDIGVACTRALTVDYSPGSTWPLPFSADLASAGTADEIDGVVQVVDGLWAVTDEGLRTAEPGYDRLLAVGQHTWAPGYAARASVTVHEFGSWAGIGMAVGWQGHTGAESPPSDWPVGGLGWVRNKDTGSVLEITTFDQGTRVRAPATLEVGQTYVFEMRTTPVSATRMQVEVGVWNAAESQWDAVYLVDELDLRAGSVLLLSHAADTTWHDIEVWRPGAPADGGVAEPGDAGADAEPPLDGDSGAADAGASDGGGSDDGYEITCAAAPASPADAASLGWLVAAVLGARRALSRRRPRPARSATAPSRSRPS